MTAAAAMRQTTTGTTTAGTMTFVFGEFVSNPSISASGVLAAVSETVGVRLGSGVVVVDMSIEAVERVYSFDESACSAQYPTH